MWSRRRGGLCRSGQCRSRRAPAAPKLTGKGVRSPIPHCESPDECSPPKSERSGNRSRPRTVLPSAALPPKAEGESPAAPRVSIPRPRASRADAAASASRFVLFLPRSWAFLTIGLPARTSNRTSTGSPRSACTRCDRGGRPPCPWTFVGPHPPGSSASPAGGRPHRHSPDLPRLYPWASAMTVQFSHGSHSGPALSIRMSSSGAKLAHAGRSSAGSTATNRR